MKNSYILKMILILVILIYSLELKAESDFNITKLNNPAPGVLNFNSGSKEVFKLVDNYGNNFPKYTIPSGGLANKLLKNGNWISMNENKYFLYNEYCQILDSIPNPTNLNLDFHDVLLLSNGHYLILLKEKIVRDLSGIVEGGQVDASLYVNSLVETDRTGTIYWQWNIIDHVALTDITDYYDLTRNSIDFSHINSLWEDTDGNIIISIRHFDEIAKINKTTGDFKWIMGGAKSKKNQFRFTNDTVDGFYGFSHQHSISILPNGNLLLFDNGNLKNNQYSRAVEYSFNETQKTVTKVWEYRNSPDIYQPTMGNALRLPNGNTLINWCQYKIMEVKPDKSIALLLEYDDGMIYRVDKVVSQLTMVSKNVTDNISYNFNEGNQNTSVRISVSSKTGSGLLYLQKYDYAPATSNFNDSSFTSVFQYRWIVSSDNISNINGRIYFNSELIQGLTNPNAITIYKRDKETVGSFTKLTTNYDINSKEIYADFSGLGEYVLVSNILTKPSIISPNNGIVSEPNGILKWSKVIGATNYEIQIDDSDSFNKPTINNFTNNISTDFEYKDLIKIDSCYWRVRACNEKDTTVWSNIARFTTLLPAPKLIAPYNDSLNIAVNINLNCTLINGAAEYIFELSDSITFNNSIWTSISNKNSTNIPSLLYNTTYFWRVMAIRSSDSSNWSQVWSFTTLLEEPELLFPENKSTNIDVNTNLDWKDIKTNSKYHLQFATDNSFSNIILDTNNLSKSNFTFVELKPNTTYFWRVKSLDFPKYSNWSGSWYFTTNEGFALSKPILISPENNSDSFISGKLKWGKVNNASKYNIQIASLENISNLAIDTIIGNKTEFIYRNLDLDSKYVWRVKAKSIYSESEWSEYWNITTGSKVDMIELLSPTNDELQVTTYVKLEWFEVSKSVAYNLQIAIDKEFTNIILDVPNINTNYFYTTCNKNTKYYWRVKFVEGISVSKWSDTWSYTTESKNLLSDPKLLIPEDNESAISINAVFQWNSSINAKYYHLTVSNDKDFSNVIFSKDDIIDTFFVMNGLEYNKNYFWRVSAINEDNEAQSNWSIIRNFITQLKAPTLLLPDNYSLIEAQDALFRWIPSDSIHYCTIQISTVKDFVDNLIEENEILSDSITTDLKISTKYFWRLKEIGNNNESDWSDIFEFNTKSDVSVESELKSNSIEFFPNPCFDQLNIKNNIYYREKYEIYSLNGSIADFGTINSNYLSTQFLENGIYFLRINNKYFQFIKIK